MKGGVRCLKREVLKFNLLTNLFPCLVQRLSQLERVTASAQRLPLASCSFFYNHTKAYIQDRKDSNQISAICFVQKHPNLALRDGPLGTTSIPLDPYMTIGFPTPDTLALAVENVSGLVVLRLKPTDIVRRVFSSASTYL
jgi:hypothetical protein